MEVQVIQKEEITPISNVNVNGIIHSLGEVRDFRKNDRLKHFLDDAQRCSLSWVK
jgi:hypothetical protein